MRVVLSGTWTRSAGPVRGDVPFGRSSDALAASRIQVAASDLRGWDSMLIAFLLRLRAEAARTGTPVEWEGIPTGVIRLLDLASAVPERKGAARTGQRAGLLAQVGNRALSGVEGGRRTVRFLGQVVLALGAFVRGRAIYRREDLIRTIQETGAQALPIVGTISLLVGLILAFIGAIQLSQFGAAIYVADLVGLAMTREMAAVMTAIVVAGRTGAAFAAQLGTMQGNEEIDALTTLGVPPVEFLVLPRMLALALMMPLLYVYGCFIGLFGGYLVGIGMLDLGSQAYLDRTREAVGVPDFAIGLVKSMVFGAMVAFAGCQRGIEAGRSAAAVGQATTSAVVTSIVYIIVIDAIFSVLLNVMGI
ncbi:MAG: ABC transporter permease [Magnetospirillum sp.]|nr:ABC transporter permease [Magnetospirillum sp.]